MERDVGQPLHRKQAFGALRELRADVDMQSCDVEPCRSRVADGSDRVVGDEPELRLRVRGLDCSMRLGLDPGSDADQHRCDAGRLRTGGLVECVEDDQRAGAAAAARARRRTCCCRGRRSVPRAHLRAVRTRARRVSRRRPRGLRRRAAAAARRSEMPSSRRRRAPPESTARVRARTRENSVPAVDDERRAVLIGERRRADAAHDQLAVLDGCRVGEELDQQILRVSRPTSPEPSRRRRGPCSGLRRSGTPRPRRRPPSTSSCPCGREPRPTA